MLKFLFAAAMAVALTGCAGDPAVISGLTPPHASLIEPCRPLPEIPAKDGDPNVRKKYYATTRQMYGACADRHDGLTSWVIVVVAK